VWKDSKVPVYTPLIENELARHSRLSYRTGSQPAAQVHDGLNAYRLGTEAAAAAIFIVFVKTEYSCEAMNGQCDLQNLYSACVLLTYPGP
jgi:hypothetical protein